ncbi:MAG TPA: hypothetical protein VFP58_09035 [Candidatus Eisenbacteria bacterium]|nr:hypothetical protein [Candidatus Eisenbacteria bacterium]
MKPNPRRLGLLSLGSVLVLLGGAGWLALTAPGVPYNVRELSEGRPPLLTAAMLALLLLVTLGAPAWAATAWLRRPGASPGSVLLFLLAQGVLAWLLLRASVPLEAIHDIVGFPVLRGPAEAETAGRFLALFIGASTVVLAAAAAWVAWEDRDPRPLSRCALAGALTLPVSYTVVVPFAATDNLTELMRGGGGLLPAAAIAGALTALALAGSGLSRLLAGRSPGPAATTAICLAAVPLGYVLLHLGLEPAVEKYGRTFAAIQFLLSENREHLASGAALWLRYGIAFVAGAGAVALAQHAAWVASGAPRRDSSPPA